jgi:hypothetical protein
VSSVGLHFWLYSLPSLLAVDNADKWSQSTTRHYGLADDCNITRCACMGHVSHLMSLEWERAIPCSVCGGRGLDRVPPRARVGGSRRGSNEQCQTHGNRANGRVPREATMRPGVWGSAAPSRRCAARSSTRLSHDGVCGCRRWQDATGGAFTPSSAALMVSGSHSVRAETV